MTVLEAKLDLDLGLSEPSSRSDYADWSKWPALIKAMNAQLCEDKDPRHATGCVAPGTRSMEAAEMCSLGSVVVETDLTERVADMMGMVVRANQRGANQVVTLLIEGDSHIGKSLAGQKAILKRTEDAWGGPTPPPDGLGEGRHRHMPWLYIESGATTGPVSLLVETCRSAGIPADDNTRPGVLMSRLRTNLPAMRVEGVLYDDAHTLVAAKDGKMSNQLKYMITGLPISLVFVGMNLEQSALLDRDPGKGYQAARQIEERALTIRANELALPARDDPAWSWTLRAVASRVHLLDGSEAANWFVSQRNCDSLYDVAGGRLGTATKVIRFAGQLVNSGMGRTFAEALTIASQASTR